jgi:hypothetical protein
MQLDVDSSEQMGRQTPPAGRAIYANARPTLERLPVELLQMVLDHLPNKSLNLCNAALASRTMLGVSVAKIKASKLMDRAAKLNIMHAGDRLAEFEAIVAAAKDKEIPLFGVNLIDVVDALATALSDLPEGEAINGFSSLVGIAATIQDDALKAQVVRALAWNG